MMKTRFQRGTQSCSCPAWDERTKLIAITGGPGAGKTAVLEMATRLFCRHVGVLPEAASVIFGGGFPRHPSELGRRTAQRAIFHIQREVENLIVGERLVRVGLCDRGSVDGLAYWPGPKASFWSELGTTHQRELDRYQAVVHLRTPAAEQGYNHQNELRTETAAEAREIDERIIDAWADHPRRFIIESEDAFLVKATTALEVIRELVDG